MKTNLKRIIDSTAYTIRKLKIVSLSSLAFVFSMIQEFLKWVMTSQPTELGEAIAVSGIMASLIALCQFIFRFYVQENPDTKDSV